MQVQKTLPVYEAELLGVFARVKLDREKQSADLLLLGWPVGGEVSGTAWFETKSSDTTTERGDVVLDENLASRLKNRLISVTRAGHNAADDTVFVELKIPIFGRKTLFLKRVY